MKKILVLAALVLSTGLFTVNAYTADPNTGDYTSDTTVTINLKAKPEGNENAVSVSLATEGMKIVNYTPPDTTTGWIGNTGDCENNQYYTTERVCTSMAKSTKITEGESLGTITVEVKSSTYANLTKTDENAYSDGEGIRKDSGILVEFNKAFQTNISSPQNINVSISSQLQPLIFIVAVVALLALILLILLPRIKKKINSQKVDNPSPF